MCGLVAYVGDVQPSPRLLELAARGAAARGPHAHGWAIHGQPTHYGEGRLVPASVPRANKLIAHSRLGSYGGLTPAAIQPITVDGHRFAHNGNAPDVYADHPDAASDSYAMALVYAAYRLDGHSPENALGFILPRLCDPYAVLVLDSGGTMLASRHDQPLNYLRMPGGVYVSSGDLGRGSYPLPARVIWRLTGSFHVCRHFDADGLVGAGR